MSEESDLLDSIKDSPNPLLNQYSLKNKFKELFERRNIFYNSLRFDEITDIVKRESFIDQENLKYSANRVKDLSCHEFSEFCKTLYWKKRAEVNNIKPHLFELKYEGIQVFMSLDESLSFYAQKMDSD